MPGEDFILDRSRIKYVDPTNLKFEGEGNPKVSNSITRINNPYEEFNMVVDLEVIYPNRFGCGLALDGYQNEDKYLFSSENGTLSFFGGKEVGDKKYLSTDYTDINLVNPTGNTSECLGIESIHIEYDSWIYPKVHIKFVDVRGAALMSNMEYANENNDDNKGVKRLYRSLFMMPYPIFRLRVKGYYGKSVTYYLTVSNDVQITMDANTGDYILDVDFVGSMFRIFADLPMTFISVAPYLTYGKAYWEENAKTPEDGGRFYFVNRNGSSVPMITLPEFIDKVGEVSSSGKLKLNIVESQKFQDDVNEQINTLKVLNEGCPYVRYNSKDPNSLKYTDGRHIVVFGDDIDSGDISSTGLLFVDPTSLTNNKDNQATITAIESQFKIEVIKPFIELVDKFTETKDSTGTFGISKFCEDLRKYGTDGSLTIWPGIVQCEKYGNEGYIANDWTKAEVNINDEGQDRTRQGSSECIVDWVKKQEKYEFLKKWADEKAKSLGLSEYYFLVYDSKNAVNLIDCIKNSLNEVSEDKENITKTYKRQRQEIIEEALGFSPTIRNIYNLVFAHMDTFIYCMRNCTKSVYDGRSSSRQMSNFNDCESDVNEKEAPFMPPFAGLYREYYGDDGVGEGVTRKQNVWLDEIKNGYSMPERDFVLDLLTATKQYAEHLKELESLEGGGGSETEMPPQDISRYIPLTIYDFFHPEKENNPYNSVKEVVYQSGSDFYGEIFGIFALRMFYLLSVNKSLDDGDSDKKDAKAFGRVEALNLFYAMGQNASASFIEFIKHYGDNENIKDEKNYFVNAITDKNSDIAKAWSFLGGPLFENEKGELKYNSEKFTDSKGYVNFPLHISSLSEFKNDSVNLSDITTLDSEKNKRYIAKVNGSINENLPFDTFKIIDHGEKFWNDITSQMTDAFNSSTAETDVEDGEISEDNNNLKFPARTIRKLTNNYVTVDEPRKFLKWLDNVGILSKKVDTPLERFKRLDIQILERKKLIELEEKKKEDSEKSTTSVWKQAWNYLNEAFEQFAENIYDTVKNWFNLDTSKDDLYCSLLEASAKNEQNDVSLTYFIQNPCICNDKNLDGKYRRGNLFYSQVFEEHNTPMGWAYLFLWSMPNNSNGHSEGWDGDNGDISYNGCALRLSLLREGSVYWRADYMDEHNGKDMFYKSEYGKMPTKEQTYRKFNNGRWELTFSNSQLSWENFKIKNVSPSRRKKLKEYFLEFANSKEFIKFCGDGCMKNSAYYVGGKRDNINFDYTKIFDESYHNSDFHFIQNFLLNNVLFNVPGVLDYYNGLIKDNTTDNFYCNADDMRAAFKGFMQELNVCYANYITGSTTDIVASEALEKANDPYNNTDIRIATYLTLKNLYDKWLCQPLTDDQWELNVRKQVSSGNFDNFENDGYGKSEFDSFMYIDTFYHDIGYDILTDATGIVRWLSGCMPTENMESDDGMLHYMGHSIYEFLVDVAANCGGMFLALPQMLGNKNATTMAEMFKAVPYYEYEEKKKMNDRSTFVFMYTYKPSEHLGNDDFTDDGVDLESDELTSLSDNGYPVPAFAVSYGKQNQSYFKNITLNTNQSLTTEASIAATMAIASKGAEGPRESNIYGQDLYRVKVAYSYECDFDMMGDVQIMPLMMFQLKNVPFWKGAYQIYNVSHDIQAGDITTHVKGMRINKYSLPLSDGFIITTENDEGGNGVSYTYLPGDMINLNESVYDVRTLERSYAKGGQTFDLGNVKADKPLICLTAAHGPNTTKSAEWTWSHMICSNIKERLSKYQFYDGTSYSKNIVITNYLGANTSDKKKDNSGYSLPDVQYFIKQLGKEGKNMVLSVVPHWNGDYGTSYIPFYDYTGSTRSEGVIQKSKEFAQYFTAEAKNVFAKRQTFKEMPVGMLSMGSSTEKEGKNNILEPTVLANKTGDPAVMLECTCVLTENWHANYPKNQSSRYAPSRTQYSDKGACFREKDSETGRYFISEGWLASDEGANAIIDLHVNAIKKYIDSLHS